MKPVFRAPGTEAILGCLSFLLPLVFAPCSLPGSDADPRAAPVPPAGASIRDPRIVDHMHGFDEFLSSLDRQADAALLRRAYRRHFAALDADVYRQFVGDLDRFSDQFLERVSGLLARHREDIREYTELARVQIPEATRDAQEAFGASLAGVPQYITLNLLQSNAQVRLVDGAVTIVYGMDSNAVMEPLVFPDTPRDLRVTVAHELFHAHHWSVNSFMAEWAPRFLPPRADAPMWINLWSEGLASCASRHVYPDAKIAHVLSFEGIWEQAQPRLAELTRGLVEVLDATDPETTARWLYIQLPERTDGLPNKAGYIVATVAAHRIVAEHGLEAATALAGDELRETFESAIAALADGEPLPDTRNLCQPNSGAKE